MSTLSRGTPWTMDGCEAFAAAAKASECAQSQPCGSAPRTQNSKMQIGRVVVFRHAHDGREMKYA